MNIKERTKALREDPNANCNCTQAVLLPFAEELGLDTEPLYRLASNFGGGMKVGGTCGAVTGGLMALGLLGKGEETARAFQAEFEAESRGIDCAELLRLAAEDGTEKKDCCDALVYLASRLVEKYR